jgi:hypothetical protein
MAKTIHGVFTDYCEIPEITADMVGTGYCSIPVKVTGFWGDAITIYLRRNSTYDQPLWLADVRHSSGGTERGFDPLVQEMNFGRAVIRSVEHAKWIIVHQQGVLEDIYQSNVAEYKAYEEKQRQENEARLAEDPELGVHVAAVMVKIAISNIRTPPFASVMTILVYERNAEKHCLSFTGVKLTSGNRLSFYFNGNKVGKDDLIRLLALRSNRTVLKG